MQSQPCVYILISCQWRHRPSQNFWRKRSSLAGYNAIVECHGKETVLKVRPSKTVRVQTEIHGILPNECYPRHTPCFAPSSSIRPTRELGLLPWQQLRKSLRVGHMMMREKYLRSTRESRLQRDWKRLLSLCMDLMALQGKP